MDVTGKTRITGIFGYPIEHTLSPLMHNAAFKDLALDMFYIAFSVVPSELTEAVSAIKALNLMGVNITVPHKENVIPLLDKVDQEASFIGAVNTIVNSEGILTGYNTDGRGFMNSLSEREILVDGKDILIIGAGGASRAISYYLSEKAAKLYLFDIDKQKAEKLSADLGKLRDNIVLINDVKEAGQPHIIINATPLGLKTEDPLPFDPGLITADMTACDLVYKNTGFLQEAEKKGAVTIDGSGMLLWQGILAFELWTGKRPPVDIMRKALMSGIGR